MHVLVVDDDPIITRLLTGVLTADGHRVTATTDAREALALLALERFDLVVLDIVMPHLDGLQLLDKARERNPGADVVLMSGYGSEGVVREGRRRGAAGFVAKPFEVEVFRAVVREVLARRQA